MLSLFLFVQYYISARHMALAKAFPDSYVYEPNEPGSVSQLQLYFSLIPLRTCSSSD